METTCSTRGNLRPFALFFVAAALLVAAEGVTGASVDVTATDWIESLNYDAACTVNEYSELLVSFNFQNPGSVPREPRLARVFADESVQNSAFHGDLLAAGARGIRFRITSAGGNLQWARIILVGPGESPREWKFDVQVPPGQTVTNIAHLDYALWRHNAPKPPYTAWLEDLRNVKSIGLYLAPSTYLAQSFVVGSFCLFGDDGVIGAPAQLTPGQRSALLERFGVQQFENVVADKGVDTDLDGMSDYQEIIVGTGWNDANQRFESDIESSSAGINITWACNGESVYNLRRATDINGDFVNVVVSGQEDLIPTEQEVGRGTMTRPDPSATGPGPYYYRVIRKGNR